MKVILLNDLQSFALNHSKAILKFLKAQDNRKRLEPITLESQILCSNQIKLYIFKKYLFFNFTASEIELIILKRTKF